MQQWQALAGRAHQALANHPALTNRCNSHAQYFEDVGSLRNYYRAHMSLARGTLKLPLCDKDRPLYTEPRMLPPTQVCVPYAVCVVRCMLLSAHPHAPHNPTRTAAHLWLNNHNATQTHKHTHRTQANNTRIEHTMMGEGCRVVGSSLRSCVVGACTYIDHGCDIQVCIAHCMYCRLC